MGRLIRNFAGLTCLKVRSLTLWVICRKNKQDLPLAISNKKMSYKNWHQRWIRAAGVYALRRHIHIYENVWLPKPMLVACTLTVLSFFSRWMDTHTYKYTAIMKKRPFLKMESWFPIFFFFFFFFFFLKPSKMGANLKRKYFFLVRGQELMPSLQENSPSPSLLSALFLK